MTNYLTKITNIYISLLIFITLRGEIMSRKEFLLFLEENRKKYEQAKREFEKHSLEFDKIATKILSR